MEFNTLIREIKDLAIFAMDLQGRPTTWNEGVERLLGFTEAEFVGHDVNRIIFIPQDLEKRIPEKELEYAAQHGLASDDRWLRRKDGTRFYASGFTTALYRNGQVIGYTKAFRDLTEMKQTESQAFRLHASGYRHVLTEPIRLDQAGELIQANRVGRFHHVGIGSHAGRTGHLSCL